MAIDLIDLLSLTSQWQRQFHFSAQSAGQIYILIVVHSWLSCPENVSLGVIEAGWELAIGFHKSCWVEEFGVFSGAF